MNLFYRGVQHSFNASDLNLPKEDMSDTVAIGTYRGASMRVCKTQKTLTQQPGLDLKYRGVTYSTKPVMVAEASAPTTVTDDKVRTLVLNHHRAIRQRHQAVLSRFAHQIGLSDLSTSPNSQGHGEPIMWTTGDRTYDRSHVAFS